METIIAAFGGAIVGAIASGIMNLFNNEKLYEMNKFEQAAGKFRACVLGIFEGVYPSSTGNVLHPDKNFITRIGRLDEKYPDLLRSYTEFSYYVQDKKDFEKTFLTLLGLCRRDDGSQDVMTQLCSKGNGYDMFDKTIDGFLSFAEWNSSRYNKTEAVIQLAYRIFRFK